MSQISEKRQKMSTDTDHSTEEKLQLEIQAHLEKNVCEQDKNVMRAFNKNVFGLFNEKSVNIFKEYFDKGL